MTRRILSLCVAALAASAIAACSAPPAPEAEGSAGAEPPRETLVESVRVQRTDFREVLPLGGVTEPIRSANVTSEIPGRITRFTLEDGQDVEEGDTVLRVSTADLGAQRDQLEAQRDALDGDIERARRLVARGIGTQADLDTFEAQRAILQTQIDTIDVRAGQARTSAPISGVVVETMVESGEYANPGAPVARIIDVSTIVVRVGLPEREIGFVREGMSIPVRIEATGQELMGTLAEIGLEANRANRTFPLEIHIDNAERAVRSGMRATVILTKRDLTDVVIIPRDAVLQAIDGQEVMVSVDGVAEARAVDLGAGRGPFVRVRSGLDPGAELIVRGHRMLVPGEPIRTADLGACCDAQLRAFLGEDAP